MMPVFAGFDELVAPGVDAVGAEVVGESLGEAIEPFGVEMTVADEDAVARHGLVLAGG